MQSSGREKVKKATC